MKKVVEIVKDTLQKLTWKYTNNVDVMNTNVPYGRCNKKEETAVSYP